MKVSDAVEQRSSIRAFLDRSVENSLIENLLQKSSRAASGGNLQPWKVYVINNSAMNDFLEFQTNWTEPEVPAYDIYPPKLKEPYRTSRYELGEQMYELLGIGRDNKVQDWHKLCRTLDSLERPVLFSAMLIDKWALLNGLI